MVLVIDNGSGSTKIGVAGQTPRVLPNQIVKPKGDRRSYIGDQLNEGKDKDVGCVNTSALNYRRPFDKGYLVNWEVQHEIWDYAFSKEIIPSENSLLLTEPLFNIDSLKKKMYEMVYEEYQFQSLCCASAPFLSLLEYKFANPESKFAHPSTAQIVVDSGYSFTHVVPFFDNQKINHAIKRINIGGKSLTNYLKELVSFRHWNMMDETRIINIIKERVCFVSTDFEKDLKMSTLRGQANTLLQQYVLPDFVNSNTGYIKGSTNDPTLSSNKSASASFPKEEQILPMNNERFTVPELLMRPGDIGIAQAGLPEAICQSVCASPGTYIQESLYANILLTGGNTLFLNMKERVAAELRAFVPEECSVNVFIPTDPILSAWYGGSIFAQDVSYEKYTVTQQDYLEHGAFICKKKFFL